MLGEAIAPDAQTQAAQTNQGNAAFNQQLQAAKFNNQQNMRQAVLPGMLQTLGYSPSTAQSMTGNLKAPTVSPVTSSNVLGGTGSTAGNAALGAGLSFGVPALKAALSGGGGSGLLSSLGALATNPFTIGAAALGVGALLWKKSQVHPVADEWVQGEQNPFDKSMANIDNQVKSGALSASQAQQLKTQNAQNYLSELQKFASEGSKNSIVAKQAMQTFRQWYGDPTQYGVNVNI